MTSTKGELDYERTPQQQKHFDEECKKARYQFQAAALADRYTYTVTWSDENAEFVATCAEFPSLSLLALSRVEAISNLYNLVCECVYDMLQNNETSPKVLNYKLCKTCKQVPKGNRWVELTQDDFDLVWESLSADAETLTVNRGLFGHGAVMDDLTEDARKRVRDIVTRMSEFVSTSSDPVTLSVEPSKKSQSVELMLYKALENVSEISDELGFETISDKIRDFMDAVWLRLSPTDILYLNKEC